jgi:hypothetical protein
MPEIDDHRQHCPERAAAVASGCMDGCIATLLEAAMCHWSSDEYERRLRADPTRSFFQALRDLFRRTAPPKVEAEVIPLPAATGSRRVDKPATERADAA